MAILSRLRVKYCFQKKRNDGSRGSQHPMLDLAVGNTHNSYLLFSVLINYHLQLDPELIVFLPRQIQDLMPGRDEDKGRASFQLLEVSLGIERLIALTKALLCRMNRKGEQVYI